MASALALTELVVALDRLGFLEVGVSPGPGCPDFREAEWIFRRGERRAGGGFAVGAGDLLALLPARPV